MLRTMFLRKGTSDKVANGIILVVTVGLLVLAIIRAVTIPFTHDEALSLSKFAVKSIPDIFSYKDAGGLPNNHILNTLWLKLSAATIGESTLALRMGNILGLVLFLYAALRLLSNISSPLLRAGGFLLLCCNPFMFDFFCLARGYGISNGFLLLSVWLLYQYRERPSAIRSTKLFFAAGFMVLANLNAVHVFAAIAVIVFVLNLVRIKPVSVKNVFQSAMAPFIATLMLGAAVYLPFTEILREGGTFGGETGYWEDCALQLFASSTYDASYAFVLPEFIPLIIIALLFGMTLSAAYRALRKRNYLLACALSLLFLPALTTILQHQIFGSHFPVARTILYMHVLFILALIVFAETTTPFKTISAILVLLSGLFMMVHFCIGMQHNYAIQWYYDAGNREVLDDLEKLKNETHQERLTVGITWIYEPGLNYERKQRDYQWITPFMRDGLTGEFDYYYVCPEDSVTLSQLGKKVIAVYPKSRTSLMK